MNNSVGSTTMRRSLACIAFCCVAAVSAPAAPAHELVSEAKGSTVGDQVSGHTVTQTVAVGESILVAVWNQDTDTVSTFENGVPLRTVTMSQLRLEAHMLAENGAGRSKRGYSACQWVMKGTAFANSALWNGARGMAIVPQARAIALGGGLVTNGILWVGGHYC